MTPLERHARWLLRCYPAAYRQDRGEEIIGTLLEAAPEGRTWPRVRDVRALVICGLKVRAAQNRQRTVGANLRVAVMAGLAMYLSYWAAVYLSFIVQWSSGPSQIHISGLTTFTAAVTGILIGGTVVLAWTARRAALLAGALAASVSVAAFALVMGGPAALLGPRVLQVLALVSLAALAPRTDHPSRNWLWLLAIAASLPLLALAVSYGWPGYSWVGYTWALYMPGLPVLGLALGGILWLAIDARLLIAVFTYLAVTALQAPVTQISYFPGVLATLPFLGVVLALAAPAVWQLRRQSARVIRAE